MLRAEAEELVRLLADAFDKTVSDRFEAFLIKRMMAWDRVLGRRAVDAVIDQEKHRFPRWATLNEVYGAQLGQQRGLRQLDKLRPVVDTPADWRKAAGEFADWSAERFSTRGADDLWGRYAAAQAERFAENAKRAETGQPLLPIAKIQDLVRMAFAGPPKEMGGE